MKFLLKISLAILILFIVAESCVTMQSRWQNAVSKNSIKSYNEYLKRYPKGPFSEEAYSRLENLHWEAATASKQLRYWDETQQLFFGYEEYLKKYPHGKFAEEAYQNIEELLYEDVIANRSITSCLDYIKKFPNGRFLNEVQLLKRTIINSIKTVIINVEGFEEFNKYQEKPLDFEGVVKAYMDYVGIVVSSGDSKNVDANLNIDVGIRRINKTLKNDIYKTIVSCTFGFSPEISLVGPPITGSFKNRNLYQFDELLSVYTVRNGEFVNVFGSKQRQRLGNKDPLPEKHEYLQFIDFIYKHLVNKLWEVKPLIPALHDKSNDVKCKAAIALGKIVDVRALPELDSLRYHEDTEVRSCAERAFQKIKNDPNAAEILLSALRKIKFINTMGIQDTINYINNSYSNALEILAGNDLFYYLLMIKQEQENNPNHKNELTVNNNCNDVVYIKIRDMEKDTFVRQIIIHNDEKYTFYLPNGSYKEYVRLGTNPNSYRYFKGQGFKLIASSENWVSAELTLEAVIDGNYASQPSTKKEFESL